MWEGYCGRGMRRRLRLLPRKIFFYLKWRVLVHSERYSCLCPRQKMLKFSPEVVIWWTLKDVLLGNGEWLWAW